MNPPCACDGDDGHCGFVPLVRLKFNEETWNADDFGARYVHSPFYGEALTHIVGISWNHGGETALSELRGDYPKPAQDADKNSFEAIIHARYNGQLASIVLTFDRPLELSTNCQESDTAAITSQLADLILLEYVELQDCFDHDLDGDDPPVTIAVKRIELSPCRRQLILSFPWQRIEKYSPVRLRLFINCDMLLDERGRAVDGDHVAGRVPNNKDILANRRGKHGRSGNGREGGLFHSWTRIPK
jgi:hypothetical protein